ncbi:MAG: hypothetical protein ABR923_10770 [Terracidiphilus sp.]
MKSAPMLAVFAFSSLSLSSLNLIAQQPDQAQQQPSPAEQQQQPNPVQAPSAPAPAQSGSAQAADAAKAAATPVEMSPVTGELVGKLDSKSAKTGDQVVVRTSEAVKTADGTVIPKGSKLVGHVAKVQSHSQGSENSAVAIAFDHAELKGGQSVQIESVIKSLAPAPGDAASNSPDMMSAPTGGSAPSGGGMAGRPGEANPGSTTSTVQPQMPTAGTDASSKSGTANAGTVVGKMGDDPIRTTSIPGVFLASTTPSEAATLSGMLFAAKSEVHLDGGAQVGMEVALATSR